VRIEAASEEFDIPKELARREDRLKAIDEAMARIKAREADREAQDEAEHQEILDDRTRIEEKNGKKLQSRPPKRTQKGVRAASATQSDRRGIAHHAQ